MMRSSFSIAFKSSIVRSFRCLYYTKNPRPVKLFGNQSVHEEILVFLFVHAHPAEAETVFKGGFFVLKNLGVSVTVHTPVPLLSD